MQVKGVDVEKLERGLLSPYSNIFCMGIWFAPTPQILLSEDYILETRVPCHKQYWKTDKCEFGKYTSFMSILVFRYGLTSCLGAAYE